MSTPSKKRKVERTWDSLVMELPQNDIIDLPGLLTTRIGLLLFFCGIVEPVQRLLLEQVLGDTSPLINKIMECMKVKQGTLIDQIYEHELAPSTKLSDDVVKEVLAALFQLTQCKDIGALITFIKSKKEDYLDAPNFDSIQGLNEFVCAYSSQLKFTLYVNLKKPVDMACCQFSLYMCVK